MTRICFIDDGHRWAIIRDGVLLSLHPLDFFSKHRLQLPDGVDWVKDLDELEKKFLLPGGAVENPRGDTIEAAKEVMHNAVELMERKNADYGDSWRLMRQSSITDQILVKINRVRTIEESGEAPMVSEGIESEYRDILNYCVFALIKLKEE